MRTQLPRRAPCGRRIGLTVLLVCAAALTATTSARAANPCADCHDDQYAALQATAHRGVVAEGSRMCEACHGSGAAHMDSGEASDIRGPAKLANWGPSEQATACLSCHASDFPGWGSQPHAGLVSCWTCHRDTALHFEPQAPALPRAARHATWQLCTKCHSSTRAEFRLEYRHPVEQGLVDCTDCHDIHGRESEAVLEAQVPKSACFSCHQEQRGPYLFEHLAMDEGCVSCHSPHGSWNRGLLNSTGNGVCLSCHLQSNFPGVGQTPHDFRLNGGARCWDCHSEVHGSNTTPDLNPRGRR